MTERLARPRNSRLAAVGICCADHVTPSIRKFGTNFADKWRLLGRYSSLADYRPRSFCERLAEETNKSQALSSSCQGGSGLASRGREMFLFTPVSRRALPNAVVGEPG
jgi:hypothetical protein